MFRTIAFTLLTALPLLSQTKPAAAKKPFDVVEAGIGDMRRAMEQGQVTSRELVAAYLTRIALYEDQLHCIITFGLTVMMQCSWSS